MSKQSPEWNCADHDPGTLSGLAYLAGKTKALEAIPHLSALMENELITRHEQEEFGDALRDSIGVLGFFAIKGDKDTQEKLSGLIER